MDQRASRGGFIPPQNRARRETRGEDRSDRAGAHADRRGGVGQPIVSRTPVVEWSGCGNAYKAPGVAVPPRPVAAAPCSRASCTWTNARSAAAVGSPAAAAGLKQSYAVVRCNRARCIRCSSGYVVRDRLPLPPSAATARRTRSPVRTHSEDRPGGGSEGK